MKKPSFRLVATFTALVAVLVSGIAQVPQGTFQFNVPLRGLVGPPPWTAPVTSAPVGDGQAQLAFTPSTAALSVTQEAEVRQVQLSLRNTGAASVSGLSVSSSSDRFGISTSCAPVLSPGQTCSVTVSFSSMQSLEASTTITATSTTASAQAVVAGSADIPTHGDLQISTASLSFGNVQTGQPASVQQVTLTNPGELPVTLSDIRIDTGSADFTRTSTCQSTLGPSGSCTVAVLFTPSVTGARSGSLSIDHTGAAGTRTVALSGTGVPPDATFADIAFGGRAVNSSTDLTATLSNTGVGPLSVTTPTAVSVTGPGFSYQSTTCGASLAAGSSCTVTVRFNPTVGAVYSGALTLATSAGDKVSSLSGTGQQAVLALTPAAPLTFGNVQVDSVATSAALTLTNSGNIAAAGLAITPPTGYSIQGSTCTATLAAGGNCTFTVRFAPAAVQPYNGDLVVTSPAAPMGATKPVTGAGLGQSTTLSNIDFGSRPAHLTSDLTATLTNTGLGPLSVTVPTAASVAGAGFSFQSTTCTTSIAAGATCTVTVQFAPTTNTSYSGTLTVATGAGSKVATLGGTGQQAVLAITPAGLQAFGNVQVGQTATSGTMTLTNSGNIAAAGLALTPPTGYSIQGSTCTTTLAAGGSCTFTVRFAPAAVQAYSGDVTATSTAASVDTAKAVSGTGVNAQTATLSDVDFGSQAAGSATDLSSTLTNTGPAPLTVTVPTTGSVTGAGFSFVSTTCTSSLPVEGSCTITVRYAGTGANAALGELTLATGAGTKTAALSGQSQAAILTFSVSTIDFGLVRAGASEYVYRSATLANTGNIPTTISARTVTHPVSFDSTGSTCQALVILAPGQTCEILIRLMTSFDQVYSGTLSVTSSDALIAAVPYTATVAVPSFTVTAPLVETPRGTASIIRITVHNSGPFPLTRQAPTLNSTSFIYGLSDNCPSILEVGASCEIQVGFHPTSAQVYTTTLRPRFGAGPLAPVITISGQGL